MDKIFINSEKNIIESIQYSPEQVLDYTFKESWIGVNNHYRDSWDKFFGLNKTRKYESGWWDSNLMSRFLCETNSQADIDKFGRGLIIVNNRLVDRAKIVINTKNIDTNGFTTYTERFDSNLEAKTRVDALKNFSKVKFLEISNDSNTNKYNGYY